MAAKTVTTAPHVARERIIRDPHHTVYPSLQAFIDADEYPSGVLTVMLGGIPIDIKNENHGYDTTTIVFHAALTGAPVKFPLFSGHRLTEDLPTNRVYVMDPSLYLDEGLPLSWFMGSKRQPRLQVVLRRILLELTRDSRRVVTFGASAGGFASLYYSHIFEGGTAIAVNPQTNLQRYHPGAVTRYAKIAWDITGPRPAAQIPAHTDLGKLYSLPRPNRVVYVQNTGDHHHVEKHMKPFLDALHPQNNVHPVMVDVGDGHVAPPLTVLREILSAAINGDEAPPRVAEHRTAHIRSATTRETRWPEGQEPTRYGTLEEFHARSETPQGNIEIMHGGHPIHVNWQDRGLGTTLVLFTAAVKKTVTTVPVYSGRRVAADLAANVLMISDPTLKASTEVTLAYYAGSTNHPNLQADLTSIIGSLTRGHRVIFFGGSGGGFPALEQATRFPGSTVFLLNPLTHVNLIKRGSTITYFKHAWKRKPPADPNDVRFVNSVIDAYSHPVDTQVLCIYNSRDDFHIKEYWQPFLDALHPENRVETLWPTLGEGHTGPTKQSMARMFECVVEHAEWDELTRAARDVKITHLPE